MAKVALLIGISTYLEPGLVPLPSSKKDVEAMQRVLQQREIGEFDQVQVLVDPDRQVMEEAIDSLFSVRQREDLTLLYFSGHGIKDESGKLYLTTQITRKNYRGELVKPTAVSASFIQDVMTSSRSRRQVVVLDCCFSGAFAEGLSIKDDGTVDIQTQLGGEGRAILTSSASTQYSFCYAEDQLSTYTRYFIEGLETGAADLNGDGMIAIDELHDYTKRKVQEAAPAMKPEIYAAREGFKIRLTRAPAKGQKLEYRREVELHARKGKISAIGRQILATLQEQLGLHLEEANAVESEVLKPFREYQEKLQKYEKTLSEAVQQEYPLNLNTHQELQDLQHILGLLDEDLAPIKERLTKVRQDWGEMIDVSMFCGRIEELKVLEQWIVHDRCRVISIMGMGGIGKTSLAVKLVQRIQDQFEYVIWRSFRNPPPVEQILTDAIKFFSNQKDINLPRTLDDKISRLLEYLRKHRCLMIVDNAESLLQSGHPSSYREDFDKYGEVLRRLAEEQHNSCLLGTSRERFRELSRLEGEKLPVRRLSLQGLKRLEAQDLFAGMGLFTGLESEWNLIVENYSGNPLALKIIAGSIRDTFNGEISRFIEYSKERPLVYGDMQELLDHQFNRLSNVEKEVICWLAINRELVTIAELQEDIISAVSQEQLLAALDSLWIRSMIERLAGEAFTLHPLLMEYITDKLIDRFCEEIRTGQIDSFNKYALIKAQSKDYIRDAQTSFILKPLKNKILRVLRGKENLESQLLRVIEFLKEDTYFEPGYAGGNIINLLTDLKENLSGYDFSNLTIQQACLQSDKFKGVIFSGASISKSLFTHSFDLLMPVAINPDGKSLATGHADGSVYVWQIKDNQLLKIFRRHTNWVYSLAFSFDGQTLASGGSDNTICIWDVSSGRCLHTLYGHSTAVQAVAFSQTEPILASGSGDKTVKIWSLQTGQLLKTLEGHTQWVRSIAFNIDGITLASGSLDSTVRIWNVITGGCLRTLQGHSNAVRSVAFSPDGETLLSGSADNTAKIWDINTGQCLKTLQGHTNWIQSVAFSPNGEIAATGSLDQTVKIWNISTEQCIKMLQGFTNSLLSIAFHPQGRNIATSSADQAIRIWDIDKGHCIKTIQGYTNWIWSIAFSPDGQFLASGSSDCSIRIWNAITGECLKILQGHTNWIQSVAFSPDGKTLASGSADHTIRVWSISEEECLKILQDHTNWVQSVAFSPDGKTLASGSVDQTLRLWDLSTGQCIRICDGHESWIRSVIFTHSEEEASDGKASSPEELLASCSGDQTVQIWDLNSSHDTSLIEDVDAPESNVYSLSTTTLQHWISDRSTDYTESRSNTKQSPRIIYKLKCPYSQQDSELESENQSAAWQEGTNLVWSIAFCPDGVNMASGTADQKVRVWNFKTGQNLKTLEGHQKFVWAVAFSSCGQKVISGSDDTKIKVWDVNTGNCLRTLEDHTRAIRTIACNPLSSNIVASGGEDGTIRIWDIETGRCTRILMLPKLYEGLNIQGVTGLTEAQKDSLKALGAVED